MRLWAFILLFLLISSSTVLNAQPLRMCGGEEEWCPFSFYPRENGKPDKTREVGVAVELLEEVFKLMGMEYSIDRIPWTRCQRHVECFGKSGRYEAFYDGGFSVERTKKYYLSVPLYETHEGVFYSKTIYPDGLHLMKPADLNNFKICGVLGYSYDHFYTDYGLSRNHKVDMSAKTAMIAIKKVSLGRCDVFINDIEPIHGGVAGGLFTMPPDIAHIAMPKAEPFTYHLFVAKTSPRAYELITKINQALITLEGTGVKKAIFKKYIPEN